MLGMMLAQEGGLFVVKEVPGYAVGWMTLALINAGLAQSKNRSGLVWFLISCLIGPIATFLLVAFCGRKGEERG